MLRRQEDRVIAAVERKMAEAYQAGYRDGIAAQSALEGQRAAMLQASVLRTAPQSPQSPPAASGAPIQGITPGGVGGDS